MEALPKRMFRVATTWCGPINAEPPPPKHGCVRLICVSDTHGFHKKYSNFPLGDILIHGARDEPLKELILLPIQFHFVAGDFTNYGTAKEISGFAEWLATLPHAHKVVICGNHEYGMDASESIFSRRLEAGEFDSEEISLVDAVAKLQRNCTYLENSAATIHGLTIYGTPSSVGMGAFGLPRGSSRAKEHWTSLPSADIIVTHGPPAGDLGKDRFGRDSGDVDLLERILQMQPLLHCFGHIHESYGVQQAGEIWFVNAATTDKSSPVVVDLAPVT
eukprot:TRINITY_DN6941_c0_g1_i1.p1 TRINITY_DN6941_c0_g1~~TRINITY_DN6941_c0_g1_i1.p1  ORF type:complete len:275 (+),score=19.20 TRINITY_DN6941_c0_g1_i1:461-1285(+)